MQESLNLESWEGWAKYADNPYDKAVFTFVDSVIDNQLSHSNPLAYNTESNVKPPQMVIDVLDLVSSHLTIPELYAQAGYHNLPMLQSGVDILADCTIQFANLKYIGVDKCKQHFSDAAIKAIHQWWLNNDYNTVAYISVQDYGIQQYIIG